jgi:hypothetical protein
VNSYTPRHAREQRRDWNAVFVAVTALGTVLLVLLTAALVLLNAWQVLISPPGHVTALAVTGYSPSHHQVSPEGSGPVSVRYPPSASRGWTSSASQVGGATVEDRLRGLGCPGGDRAVGAGER